MILAAVPADRLGMLRAAGDEFVVVPAETWESAFDAIRLRPVDNTITSSVSRVERRVAPVLFLRA